MCEETVPIYAIMIPIFVVAGYDALVLRLYGLAPVSAPCVQPSIRFLLLYRQMPPV